MIFSWILKNAIIVIPVSFISIVAINMFKEYITFKRKKLH